MSVSQNTGQENQNVMYTFEEDICKRCYVQEYTKGF